MITDTNSVGEFGFNALVGATGGDFLILGLVVILVIALACIVGRVKAGTALMIGLFTIFLFALFIPTLMSIFWIILIISILVLINGIRKMWMGY